MAEYIERETFLKEIEERYCLPCKEEGRDHNGCKCRACWVDAMRVDVIDEPAADVAPVVHGRWIEHEETQEDAYRHHKCSECNVNAPFDYKMREDWDEGMDGEWYSLGLVDDGINEHLTDYCPNCGARMDGDDDAKPEE